MIPTIVSLREKVETIRKGEVTRTLARIRDASPETRAAIEALSYAIANEILHAPTVKLRESSRDGASQRWALFVSELFGLQRHQEAQDGTASARELAGG
ncbi:MAG: hypothetical protein HYS14_04200 [Candidatus Rokubacteria bacterium]|nr:hypothetical protein [Candidatus Rokubacteria bacterium]